MLEESKPSTSSKASTSTVTEPKKYKCTKTCYINGFLYKAGDVITGNNPAKEYFVEIK
jgi:hypothetical protein